MNRRDGIRLSDDGQAEERLTCDVIVEDGGPRNTGPLDQHGIPIYRIPPCRHEYQCDGWTVDPRTSVCRTCGASFVFWSNAPENNAETWALDL